MDISNTKRIEDPVNRIRFSIIINCIGSLIKNFIRFQHKATFADAYFIHLLAQIATAANVKLITLSTDCVFSGLTGYYAELVPKDANDFYE